MDYTYEELWQIGLSDAAVGMQAADETLRRLKDGARFAKRYAEAEEEPASRKHGNQDYLRKVGRAAELVLIRAEEVEEARRSDRSSDSQSHLWLRLGMAQQVLYFLAKEGLDKSRRAELNKAKQSQAVALKNRQRDQKMLAWWDVRPHLKASAVAEQFGVSESTVRRADKKYPRSS
ncbi:MAG: hypothetical protein AAFY08_11960 [Planctomycetota bacterium]